MDRVRLTGEIFLHSPEETLSYGRAIGQILKPNTLLALYGDLGAGKTTFVQGLAQGLGILDSIQSPTFVTLHVYEGKIPLYHFDLYRLQEEREFLIQGLDEYFDRQGICAIEWPERISSLLPPRTLSLDLTYAPSQGRLASWRTSCS